MMQKTGILLVNLGTPDSPAPGDVRRYLIEFLTDRRVIDLPWLWRQLLVRGQIVPSRYRQSAAAYKQIWCTEGSPLKVHGFNMRDKLQQRMGPDYVVELAMRYQNPSIGELLKTFHKMNLKKICLFPLFPQYSSATTGSVHQKAMEVCAAWDTMPEILLIDQYAVHPTFIQAFCAVASECLLHTYDHLLFSFHGLPHMQIVKSDLSGNCLQKAACCTQPQSNHSCYSAQCYATAHAIATALELAPQRYSVAFQSRLGKDPWLQPYAGEQLVKLARQGIKRLLVLSPSFVCDCLETLFEIGIEYSHLFKKAGGEHLQLAPGLNAHPLWIEAIQTILQQRLGGLAP